MSSSVLWFRHGLRLHDNPALLEAIKCAKIGDGRFYAVFIFDGKTADSAMKKFPYAMETHQPSEFAIYFDYVKDRGTNKIKFVRTESIGYNRMKFLLESLADLDKQLKEYGGQLYIFRGQPVKIFHRMVEELNIKTICYEQDCEPIWRVRDEPVENLCLEIGVRCVEKVSHTLWNPFEVIKANGGIPPLTYQMLLHTVQTIGLPPRPANDPDWTNLQFGVIPKHLLNDLNYLSIPLTPEDFDIYYENTRSSQYLKWIGGETQALISLNDRLRVERCAFQNGYYLPNQAHHDLLGKATSMSAHLRYGCLSVRRFYWNLHDLFRSVQSDNYIKSPGGQHITGQLIWREYFYTMSVNNPNYGRIKDNPICLDIPWYEPNENFDKWRNGNTGYPLIDAAMRQLLAEGWLHHTLRNATAAFLTRGGLWFSWEHGLKYFLKHLLDADWSVCAGNWMWVSSSAFEKLLDSSRCTCPIALGRRLDPYGDYIKRYIPELKTMPKEFIHEPWNAPLSVQEENGCVIGIHYPERIINLKQCQEANNKTMKMLRESLISDGAPATGPPHCRPSNEDEIRQFFWLIDDMVCK